MRRIFAALVALLSMTASAGVIVSFATTAAASASAVVESSSDWPSSSGYRYFAGSVRNTGDTSLDSIRVRFNFYDASNVLVGTNYTYVDEDVLAPGALGGYQRISSVPPTFDHATTQVESVDRYSTRLATRDFSVSVTNTYSDGYQTHYAGTVTNVGAVALDWVAVRMMFRDAGNRVDGVEYTYAGFGSNHTLDPGQSASFEVTRDDDFPAASSYAIYGDTSYAPATATPTPTTSPTSAPVQPAVTAALTSSRVPVGTAASLQGTVTPFAGAAVTLRRKVGTSWAPVATKTLTSTAFSFALPTSTSRFDTYSVSVSGPGLVATTSSALSLAVYKVAVKAVSPVGSEYVVVTNPGVVQALLKGWKLKDASGRSVVLPRRTLKPGAALRVYTGRGRSTAGRLYLGTSKDLWSRHDTVKLLDSRGSLVARKKY